LRTSTGSFTSKKQLVKDVFNLFILAFCINVKPYCL
jgi:hypothetical protein